MYVVLYAITIRQRQDSPYILTFMIQFEFSYYCITCHTNSGWIQYNPIQRNKFRGEYSTIGIQRNILMRECECCQHYLKFSPNTSNIIWIFFCSRHFSLLQSFCWWGVCVRLIHSSSNQTFRIVRYQLWWWEPSTNSHTAFTNTVSSSGEQQMPSSLLYFIWYSSNCPIHF